MNCPRCTDGTYTDCNGARWACHYCRGLRTVPPYRDADNVDRISDARAEAGEPTPYEKRRPDAYPDAA